METVPVGQAVTASEAVFPVRVAEALGELVDAAREGLLALSVGVGLGVLVELLEEEVVDVVGPKGRHDPDRVAVRHGHDAGEVTLGGRRVAVMRPRARSADGTREVSLVTYDHFADRDPLSRLVLEQMLAGVSTRRFDRTREPVGSDVEADAGVDLQVGGQSRVRRPHARDAGRALEPPVGRRAPGRADAGRDRVEGPHQHRGAGITTEGVKIPLGLWEGSSENAAVATALLADLVDRGLDIEQGVLVVLDGTKALRKAVRDVLGERHAGAALRAPQGAKRVDHLPERDRPLVQAPAARGVERHRSHAGRTTGSGRSLASSPGRIRGAAASLREGLEETVTVTRLGVSGPLKRTLESTNPCESMIECVRRSSRNVKHWQRGDMALRWTAAGMLEAERQFRSVIGYRRPREARVAIERDFNRRHPADTTPPHPRCRPRSPLRSQPPSTHRAATTKFHGDRDILPRASGSGDEGLKTGPPAGMRVESAPASGPSGLFRLGGANRNGGYPRARRQHTALEAASVNTATPQGLGSFSRVSCPLRGPPPTAGPIFPPESVTLQRRHRVHHHVGLVRADRLHGAYQQQGVVVGDRPEAPVRANEMRPALVTSNRRQDATEPLPLGVAVKINLRHVRLEAGGCSRSQAACSMFRGGALLRLEPGSHPLFGGLEGAAGVLLSPGRPLLVRVEV